MHSEVSQRGGVPPQALERRVYSLSLRQAASDGASAELDAVAHAAVVTELRVKMELVEELAVHGAGALAVGLQAAAQPALSLTESSVKHRESIYYKRIHVPEHCLPAEAG
eukprot:COSAG04_NODE_3268_length_2991_cov_3.300830_4_plen_110_part_00